MPVGIYIRTEENKKNISKARKKWIAENPEKSHERGIRLGKIGGKLLKDLWENNYEEMRNNSSETMKNTWKNNREKMLTAAFEASKIGGKLGGKLTGGNNFRNAWKNNRKKMLKGCSKAGKTAWKNNREKLLEGCSIGGKAGIQSQQKFNISPIELIVREYLKELKIKFKSNVWFKCNGRRKEADIVIDKYKLIIECDGFWHNRMDTKIKDKLKTKMFNKLGYKVLRLTGTEIRNGSYIGKFLKRIRRIKQKYKKCTGIFEKS